MTMINTNRRTLLKGTAAAAILAVVGCSSSTTKQTPQAIGNLIVNGMNNVITYLSSAAVNVSATVLATVKQFVSAASAAVAQLPNTVGAVPVASIVQAVMAAVQSFASAVASFSLPSNITIIVQSLLDVLPLLAADAGIAAAHATATPLFTPQEALDNLQALLVYSTQG